MSEKQIQTFLKYLELYRYGENEFAYSLFVDRSFKYAELALVDSFTKKSIQHAPIFSCICLDKQTASMCIFDLDTLFNVMFPSNDDKKNFEVNINTQKAICPSCGEELAFNFLVFDPFLMKFHKYVSKNKQITFTFKFCMKLTQNPFERNEQVIMKMEAIRNSDKIKYSVFTPKNKANEFSGEIVLTPKTTTFSIDQYTRMQTELDREISQLKEEKKTKEGVEEEISIRHAVQTILLDQQQQQDRKQGEIAKVEKEIPFRVLKVGGSNESHVLSMKNRKMIYLEKDKLFMSLPSLSFSRKLLVFDLRILLHDGTTCNSLFQ